MGQPLSVSHGFTQPSRCKVKLDSSILELTLSEDSTSGAMLDAVLAKYHGSKQIVALKTPTANEVVDACLLSRQRRPCIKSEYLLPVYARDVPCTMCKAHFEPVKVIGKGAFSTVYLVRKKDSGQLYAMKVVPKELILRKDKVSAVFNEKEALLCLNSPFVVKLHWTFQTYDELCFVMDFCPGGELFFHLQAIGRLTEVQARFYFCEVLLAVEHMHSLHILYRDLKPENLLLDLDGHVQIADLGLSKQLSHSRERTRTYCGSPEYMPPEVITKAGHGREVDFYCLGAFLYEMLTGLPPYYSSDWAEIHAKALSAELPLPSYLSPPVKALLRGLLHKDPAQRLGARSGVDEIKKHEWLQEVHWDGVSQQRVSPPFRPSLHISNIDPRFSSLPINGFANGAPYEPPPHDPFATFSATAFAKPKFLQRHHSVHAAPPPTAASAVGTYPETQRLRHTGSMGSKARMCFIAPKDTQDSDLSLQDTTPPCTPTATPVRPKPSRQSTKNKTERPSLRKLAKTVNTNLPVWKRNHQRSIPFTAKKPAKL